MKFTGKIKKYIVKWPASGSAGKERFLLLKSDNLRSDSTQLSSDSGMCVRTHIHYYIR